MRRYQDVSDEEQQTYVVTVSMSVVVSDVGQLENWVGEHIECLPDISYSEEWVDPTDPDAEDSQPAYISDVAVYLPDDPGNMLDLAARCLMNGLPGVDILDSDWNVDRHP